MSRIIGDVFNISNTGNIGVGTSIPRNLLDIQGGNTHISGKLGIGSVIPSYSLDIVGDISFTGTLYQNGAIFSGGGGGSSSWSSNQFGDIFYNSGNVGVGTTYPIEKLHIEGHSYLNGLVTTNNNNIDAGSGTVTATTFSGTATQVSQTLTRGNYLTGNNYNGGLATTWAVDGTTAATASKVVVRDENAHIYAANLGIGTTATRYSLDIIGNANVSLSLSTQGSLTAASLTGSAITDSTSTTSSSTAASATAVKSAYDLAALALPKAGGTVTGDVTILANLTASNLTVIGDYVTLNTITSNTEQIVVNNAGTGPALKVTQSGVNSVVEFYDNETGLAMIIANNGNIGIGSDTPFNKMDINGNLYVSGSVTAPTFSGTATQVSQTLTRGNYLTGNNYNGGSATTWDVDGTTTATASKVVVRDASANIYTANIGISTSAALYPLHVVGSSYLNGLVTTNNNNIDAGSGTVTATTFSGTATQVSQTLTRGNYLTGNNYNGGSATTWAVDGTTAATASKVVVRDASANIYTSGVGIGTTVARQQLDIENGNAIISGNIGIGTTIPNEKLIVYGNSYLGKGLIGQFNSHKGGAFYKQVSWNSSNSIHTIAYPEYCVAENSCGTLNIQVKSCLTNKLGNASVSFLKSFGNDVELFTSFYHKNMDLITFIITKDTNNISINTDDDCSIAWTSIGAC